MVHHIVMWKFKPEVEDAKKPELKKAMQRGIKVVSWDSGVAPAGRQGAGTVDG